MDASVVLVYPSASGMSGLNYLNLHTCMRSWYAFQRIGYLLTGDSNSLCGAWTASCRCAGILYQLRLGLSLCCMNLLGVLWARKACCPVWRFVDRFWCSVVAVHTTRSICCICWGENYGLVQRIVCEYRFVWGGFQNGFAPQWKVNSSSSFRHNNYK